jgi:hypothetical protein
MGAAKTDTITTNERTMTMTENDDWVHDFLKAVCERAARKERGEPPGPTVVYTEVDGKMQRVDDGADARRKRH